MAKRKQNSSYKDTKLAFYKFKRACLIRNSEYMKDCEKWVILNDDVNRTLCESDGAANVDSECNEMARIEEKWLPIIGMDEMIDPEQLQYPNPAVAPVGHSIFRFSDQKALNVSINLEEPDEHIQEDIQRLVSTARKEKGVELRKWDLVAPLYKRYFAVWDLVYSKTQKLPYKKIVEKLKQEGFYSGLSNKQAETLARKDCQLANKLLGIAKETLKIDKRVQSIKTKGVRVLKDEKKQGVTSDGKLEWEMRLAKEGLPSMNELLNSSGPTIQKIIETKVDRGRKNKKPIVN